MEAIARDGLADPAAGAALERALDTAKPDLILFLFLVHPAPGLLERHARGCAKHAAMVSEILSLLPAERGERGRPDGSGGYGGGRSPCAGRPQGVVLPG
jgi:hypothetical protein